MKNLVELLTSICQRIPYSLIALIGRIGIAVTFFKSGQTKLETPFADMVRFKFDFDALLNLGVSDTTFYLFRVDYAGVPILPPNFAAYLATTAELILPILLIFGIMSRLSAFGLLMMTLVIQIFVYPSAYDTHFTWITVMLMIMSMGPGKISIDAIFAKRNQKQSF